MKTAPTLGIATQQVFARILHN